VFKPIRLHYLPGRHYDGREHPQPSPRYAAENFLQLAYGAFQVLKQKINPEPAEGNYGDRSKSRGACVFRFHIGLPGHLPWLYLHVEREAAKSTVAVSSYR